MSDQNKSKYYPRVFIGSSSEGKAIADALQLGLYHDHDVTVWDQGVFSLSEDALSSLIAASKKNEYAILVLTPDDVQTRRGITAPAARDNVLFELGLFIGSFGRGRVFVVRDATVEISLPTDFKGMTMATYRMPRDGNLQAAVGPAATKIKNKIAEVTRGIDPERLTDLVHSFAEEDQVNIVRPVLESLRDAIAWHQSFKEKEMFEGVRNQILADIRRIGRRRLTFRPPTLWDHWYKLIHSIDPTTEEIRLVSKDDLKYWIEAQAQDITEAKNYEFALREFKGKKSRILLLARATLTDESQDEALESIVKSMLSDNFRVVIVVKEDIRHPPAPFPPIWLDFGIIGNQAVSFFDQDDDDDLSRSLIESFDPLDIKKAVDDWEKLLVRKRWDSADAEDQKEAEQKFRAWLNKFKRSR